MANQFHYFLERGRKHFVEGSYEKAEQCLIRAMKLNRKEPELYQMLATIYYDRGKFKRAIQTFKLALEIDPDYTDASVGLSIVLNDIGRYDEGQSVFQQARKRIDVKKRPKAGELDKKFAQKHCELGQLYLSNRYYGEAVEQFRLAKKWYESADVTLLLASAYKQAGQIDKGLHLLRQALRVDPDFNRARMLYGKMLYETQRVAEAVGQWENVLVRDPTNREAKALIKRAQAARITDL